MDERDVCVVAAIVFSVLTLQDLAYLGGVVAVLVFHMVGWSWMPVRVARVVFGTAVPVLAYALAVNSMVRQQQGIPDELVVFVCALALAVHRLAAQMYIVSVGISWTAYAVWTGEDWRLMVLLCVVGCARAAYEMASDHHLADTRAQHAITRDAVTRRMDDVDAFNASVWEGARRNSWEGGHPIGDFSMEHVAVAVLHSEHILACVNEGRSETLAVLMRNLIGWADRWGSRLLGFHGNVLVFVCPPGPQTAVEMLTYMMDRTATAAGAVDTVRLSVSITSHGLRVSPDAIARAVSMLTPGALRAAPPVADMLRIAGDIVHESVSGASLSPLPGVPRTFEDHTPFTYSLGRTVDSVATDVRLWPVPTHPLWLAVGVAALGLNGELLKAFVGALLVGPAVAMAWWQGYADAISPLLGMLHVWAVVNAHGSFPVVAALAVVPGAPGLALMLLAALFAARRTPYLVLLGAVAGYAAYCGMRRTQLRKALRSTTSRLVAHHERVNAKFASLWRTHIPDLVNMPPTPPDGWFVLSELGRRVVAFCHTLPGGVPPGYHVVHALTGGCWVLSGDALPANVDGAIASMRDVVGRGAEIEVCAPRLLVLGGDVLVVALLGPTRARPGGTPVSD